MHNEAMFSKWCRYISESFCDSNWVLGINLMWTFWDNLGNLGNLRNKSQKMKRWHYQNYWFSKGLLFKFEILSWAEIKFLSELSINRGAWDYDDVKCFQNDADIFLG